MQRLKRHKEEDEQEGGRCISPICHRDSKRRVNRRGMSTGEGVFSSDRGDVNLSDAGSSTLWREDP